MIAPEVAISCATSAGSNEVWVPVAGMSLGFVWKLGQRFALDPNRRLPHPGRHRLQPRLADAPLRGRHVVFDRGGADHGTRRRAADAQEREAGGSGIQHLNDGDAEAALEVAAQLEELRYTASFEIAALAYGQLGDLDAAVGVLTRGVDLAPDVGLNWQLLGNYLSDLERFDEAVSAYESALTAPA